MATPTSLIRNFSQELDRIFGDAGARPRWALPSVWADAGTDIQWLPDVEVRQRNGAFLVKADLPGMKKEDVKVRIEHDRVVLEGERKQEVEEKQEGYYRTERSYGHFRRTIALPEGATPEAAKATFKDGVLEVTVPVAAKAAPAARELPIA